MPRTHAFVVCLNNEEYPASLELQKVYRVLADEDAATDGDLRVIDESGEDYIYPASIFLLVDRFSWCRIVGSGKVHR